MVSRDKTLKIIPMNAHSPVKSETGDTLFTLPKSFLRESLRYITVHLSLAIENYASGLRQTRS